MRWPCCRAEICMRGCRAGFSGTACRRCSRRCSRRCRTPPSRRTTASSRSPDAPRAMPGLLPCAPSLCSRALPASGTPACPRLGAVGACPHATSAERDPCECRVHGFCAADDSLPHSRCLEACRHRRCAVLCSKRCPGGSAHVRHTRCYCQLS